MQGRGGPVTRTVRIRRSLVDRHGGLVEYREGAVWRLVGTFRKDAEGFWATPGFIKGRGQELGPFRLRKEATGALVDLAMADGAEPAVRGRAA